VKRPIVLAAVSDVHAGSTVAVCPPEGVRLDDGGQYVPSAPQVWLWEKWGHFWGEVDRVRRDCKGTLGVLSNGDATEGQHHGSHQVISGNIESQNYVVDRVFSVPRALKPDWWVFVKGTPAHVGKGADSESALSRKMGGIREPSTDGWAWYRWKAALNGTLVDALHHGRTGGRPWTMGSAAGILAVEIMVEHVQGGQPVPNLCFRSHKHTYADSGDQHPVRVISLPAWQLMTEFGHKVVPEKLVNSTYGGVILVCHPGGRVEVIKHLYRPLPSPIWTPS
jgi:hypothetical protein